MRSNRLEATLLDRLRARGRPVWLRAVLVRRALAAGLLLAALAVAATGGDDGGLPVLVATRDLRPGVEIRSDDVELVRWPAGPELPGHLDEPDAAVGLRLSGAVRAGEPITGSRLLDSRLPESLTGSSTARLVPVRPADTAVAGLLRAGDLVDVLDETGTVLARSAVVALPTGGAQDNTVGRTNGTDSPVLLAMPEKSAIAVATAGLASAITVVLH